MQWVGERCAPEQASQPPRLLGFFTACDSLRPRILYQPQPCRVHIYPLLYYVYCIPTLPSAYTPCSICIHFNLTIVHIYNLSSICLYFSLTSYQLVEGIVPGERFNLLFQIFVCENKPKYLFGNLISKCHVFKQIIQGGFNCGEKIL